VEVAIELIQFTLANFDTLMSRTVEHIALVSLAVGIATLTGVPIGIAITKSKRAAQIVLYVAAIIVTIPSIALFGIMMPILSIFGYGIGYVPAVIAVLLYSLLPIIRNTYTAINNVDPALREAARGIGMSPNERLRLVEIPLAIPVIMAGVRTAVVLNIGVMAIAAYIGAGGLGTFISRGISQSDPRQLIVGAVAVSLLAVVVDYALLALQKRLTPKGMAKIIQAG
jgi:osmoprotectant transport system permease protein